MTAQELEIVQNSCPEFSAIARLLTALKEQSIVGMVLLIR